MDDSKQARSWVVGDMLYGVANGRGRVRGKPEGTRKTESWRLVMVSTGESPITGFARDGDGGAHARVVQLYGSPLGEHQGDLADRLKAASCECYGTVGRELLRFLVETRSRDLDTLRGLYHNALAYWQAKAGDSGPARRVAAYFAVMDIAGFMLHTVAGERYTLQEVKRSLEAVWTEAIEAATERADQTLEALGKAVEWAVANPHRFDGHGDRHTSSQGIAGKWAKDELVLLKEAIRNEVLPDHQIDGLLKSWRDREWLNTDGHHLERKRTIDGRSVRCVVLDLHKVRDQGLLDEAGAPAHGGRMGPLSLTG